MINFIREEFDSIAEERLFNFIIIKLTILRKVNNKFQDYKN